MSAAIESRLSIDVADPPPRRATAHTCKHQRTAPCAYCLCRVSPHDFYEMMRWRAELRRKGKRRAS